jgi:hypothetical protein
MATHVIVKFHTRHGVYNTNDKAHFPKPVADQLIKAGVASFVGDAKFRARPNPDDPASLKK